MKTSTQEKRDTLKTLSNVVKPLVKAGQFDTVNEAILQTIYTNQDHKIFKTYDQWKAEGKTVKKGEKAFLVWGKPKGKEKEEKTEANTDENGTFYPLCFLFSNAQVA